MIEEPAVVSRPELGPTAHLSVGSSVPNFSNIECGGVLPGFGASEPRVTPLVGFQNSSCSSGRMAAAAASERAPECNTSPAHQHSDDLVAACLSFCKKIPNEIQIMQSSIGFGGVCYRRVASSCSL